VQGETTRNGSDGLVWRVLRGLYDRPRLLLTLTFLFWSTNFIVGKHLADTVPPVALAAMRWLGAAIVLLVLARNHLRRDWPVIRRHWLLLAIMAASGIGAYNTLAYRGLHETEVINAVLTQSSAPLLIALWSIVLFGDWLNRRQFVGIVISLSGVILVLTRGHLENLLAVRINPGDVWFLAAMALYAFYSALLRRRPPIHPMSFLAVLITAGALMLLPVWALELWSGANPVFTAGTWLWIVHLVVFPSILAYLFFNRGVELLGANASGPYFHLMPLFVSVLAIVFLGERLAWFHPIGFVLIVGGVVLATSGGAKAQAAAEEPPG
jgi:drug/metabolite transporter (DMT)-like permease